MSPARHTTETPRAGKPRRWRRIALLFIAWCVVPVLLLTAVEGALRASGYGLEMGPLVRIDCEQGRVYGINRDFYHQFMGEELDDIGEEPPDVVIPESKPANAYRVVVLGGSAAQGWVDSNHGFWRILDKMLGNAFPELQLEVYCMARHGMNSPVMRRMAEESAAIQPDCFVVYLGHNEMVGPFGLVTDLGRLHLPAELMNPLIQSWMRVGNLRLLQAAGALQGVRDKEPMLYGWGYVAPLNDPDDPRLTRICNQFEQNLRAIGRTAEGLGADVVLCTLARNLSDIPPAVSIHDPRLSEDTLHAWETRYDHGVKAQAAGNREAALAAYREAAHLDDTHAELHFRMAQCALAAGDVEAARAGFRQAANRDAGLGAATEEINARIVRVATESGNDHQHLVQTEGAFKTDTPHGLPDKSLFFDRIHFRFEGNYRLARAVYETLAPLMAREAGTAQGLAPALGPEEARRRIAYSPADELATVENALAILERHGDYPVAELRAHAETLRGRVGSAAPRLQREACRYALEKDADEIIRLRYVDALGLTGDLAQALAEARRAVSAQPCSWPARWVLALALDQTGHDEEAVDTLAQVMPLYGRYVSVQREYGRRCWSAGREKEAVAALQRALALKPRDTTARLDLAELHVEMKRFEQTLRLCETVLAAEPEHSRALLLRGKALTGLSRQEDARAAFEAAIRSAPDDPSAYTELGLMLAGQGEWAAARPVLEEAVALRERWGDPGPATRVALVDTLCALNEFDAARRALAEAERLGVEVPPQTRACIEGGAE